MSKAPRSKMVMVPEGLRDYVADLMEENADALKAAHTQDGKWVINEPSDGLAAGRYVQEKRLAAQLRACR